MKRTVAITLLILAGIVAGFIGWDRVGLGERSDRPLKVGIVSWPGYAGGLVANRGFKPNRDSIFWTKYHQLVEFVLLEDVNVRAKLFARGGPDDVDIVWTT